MAAQATGSTGECLSGYSGSSKSVPGAMTTTPVESSPTAKRPRFSFESDTLALKSNPDYCQLLKNLAVLEAQKMQAIKDIEVLLHVQAKAEKDPLGFLQSLKDGTLEPLPKRQEVAVLPKIEWKGYVDSLQQVARQNSSIYLNTRRQGRPQLTLDEKPVTSKHKKDSSKSATYGQPWTVEEQARFEELLKVCPPEPVERRRFKKIAKALGTRTTQQVATHVQKYFIKLANAGLPVPGRMPNINKYPKKKGKKKKRSLKRPSTFFSTLTPSILMKEASDSPSTSSGGHNMSACNSSDDDSFSSDVLFGGRGEEEEEEYDEDEEEDEEECSGLGDFSRSSSPQVPTVVRCLKCDCKVEQGVYWQCSDCDVDTPTHLCNSCINSDYRSSCHSPTHNMQLLSLAPPNAFLGNMDEGTLSSYIDKDYVSFSTQHSQTGYNYLDPNFYPAS